jgi:hypothetical protein
LPPPVGAAYRGALGAGFVPGRATF